MNVGVSVNTLQNLVLQVEADTESLKDDVSGIVAWWWSTAVDDTVSVKDGFSEIVRTIMRSSQCDNY